MNLKRLGALLLALSLFFLAACGRSEPDPEATPEPEPEVTTEAEPEATPEAYIGPRNPLTGVPTDEDISYMRPWAILYDNLRAALPHNGISQADIIYEIPVEGGITRILALFQDIRGVGEIGPVRSARHYFIDVVQAHDALFVHAGGSNQAYEAIRNRSVPNIDGVNGHGREFYRDSERARRAGMEHSMMTTDELLLEHIDGYGFRREHEANFRRGLAFTTDGTPEGQRAHEVSVRFSNVKTGDFVFNPASGRYYVSQHNEPMIDGITEEQLSVTNVLVLFANFTVLDNEGRLGVDFNLGGEGYYISGGQAVPIIWSKAGYAAPFIFSLQNGYPLELSVGTSYINIVNSNTGEVTIR